jgi:hypothetical protein
LGQQPGAASRAGLLCFVRIFLQEKPNRLKTGN